MELHDATPYEKVLKERDLWKKLSKAQDGILVAYRLQRSPAGKWVDQASSARAALAKMEMR